MSNTRPTIEEYMMNIALTVRSRANCKGSKVGAVLAREGHMFQPATTERHIICQIAMKADV